MGGEAEKNDSAAKEEKKDKKHEEVGEKEKEKSAKDKDKKKKKDKDGNGDQEEEDGGKEEKKKKNKNPEDQNDPTKLKQKLDKIDAKMQALAAKREEILKQINAAGHSPAQPPPSTA